MKNILFRLENPRLFLLVVLLLFVFNLRAADEFPPRPEPPRLVNDFTGVLSSSQARALENKLDAFNKQTSTQITLAIVKDIYGYDKGDYAVKLAEQWGVGQKGKNNGILILVKPKTGSGKGEVFIAVGYGLEGAVPDITARKTIISNEILPDFKLNDYYTGLDKATTVLMKLTAGEFTADQYDKQVSKQSPLAGFVVLLLIFAVIMLFNRNRYRTMGANGGGGSLLGTFWLLSMLGGNRGGGSWGDFSGGGGSDGGSFGGGGAGGEW